MADKDALNQTLNESCAELREKNANMKETVKKAEDALQKIQEQEQAHRDEMTALELENKRKIRELEQQLKEVQNENERSRPAAGHTGSNAKADARINSPRCECTHLK